MPLVVLLLITQKCALDSSCQDSVLEQSRSPDGDYTAVMLARKCGVTTTITRHVQLLRRDEVPSMKRSSLLSIKNTALWVDTTSEEYARHREILRIGAQWLAKDTLVITLDPRAKLAQSPPAVSRGVHITLRERRVVGN